MQRETTFRVDVLDGSEAVVHVELNRVGGHPETCHFFHLQFDIGIQHFVAEHSALREEGAVLIQIRQGFIEGSAGVRNILRLFRREVV